MGVGVSLWRGGVGGGGVQREEEVGHSHRIHVREDLPRTELRHSFSGNPVYF